MLSNNSSTPQKQATAHFKKITFAISLHPQNASFDQLIEALLFQRRHNFRHLLTSFKTISDEFGQIATTLIQHLFHLQSNRRCVFGRKQKISKNHPRRLNHRLLQSIKNCKRLSLKASTLLLAKRLPQFLQGISISPGMWGWIATWKGKLEAMINLKAWNGHQGVLRLLKHLSLYIFLQ